MGDVLDFANVYPSILNLHIVGLMAVIFIVFYKWLAARWSIPYFSQLIASV